MSNSRALLSLMVMLCFVAAAPNKQDIANLSKAAAHADVVAAVKTQNARDLSITVLKVIDQRWFLGKESVLVRQTTTGKCSEVLREFAAANPAYAEAFVLDRQGSVVCANARTAQYWYGEEPFWQRAFNGETFRDATLLSVPVKDEERIIGVLAIRVERRASARRGSQTAG